MLPLWLVYILIVLLLVLDVLFVLEVAVVGVFLVAYILFNIATALLGRKIDRYIKARLDRMKQEEAEKSEDRGKVVGHAKTVYSVAFLLYRIYDIISSVVIGLIAFVLLVLGFVALAVVNIVLFWLLNAYIL